MLMNYLMLIYFISLPSILEANPDVDVYLVPRINTVSGITEEHIQEMEMES
jgi:hypothetical protein